MNTSAMMAQMAAQQQGSWAQQKQADRDAKKAAADAAADAKHQDDVQKMMNSNSSDNSFIPKQPEVLSPKPVSPTSGNCTSTTTSQSTGNAGSSTTTTTCSN